MYDGDPSYEAFDIHDEEDMKQRQEKIADRDRKNEELARIANFYEEEEAFFASTERAL